MEVKHVAWKNVIWQFYEGQKDPWWGQCVEPSWKTEINGLMIMLGLNESIDQLVMASSVCWYGHVLRREDGHVLRVLNIEVEGQKKKGRPKRTWKKQVEDESVEIGLRREDALCQSKWSVGVNQIAAGLRWIWSPSLVGVLPDFNISISLFTHSC